LLRWPTVFSFCFHAKLMGTVAFENATAFSHALMMVWVGVNLFSLSLVKLLLSY